MSRDSLRVTQHEGQPQSWPLSMPTALRTVKTSPTSPEGSPHHLFQPSAAGLWLLPAPNSRGRKPETQPDHVWKHRRRVPGLVQGHRPSWGAGCDPTALFLTAQRSALCSALSTVRVQNDPAFPLNASLFPGIWGQKVSLSCHMSTWKWRVSCYSSGGNQGGLMEDSHLFLQIVFEGGCGRRVLTSLDLALVSGPVPPMSPLPSTSVESGHRQG